jgi:hypothetical protein
VRNPFVRRHPFSQEDLSAFLDGQLSPARSARLEEHLASCEPCRQHLGELRAVVEGLRALPSISAPRSFALRPEQVEAPRRQAPIEAPKWAFGPAGAAATALLLFLVLVGVDLGTLGGGGAPEEREMPTAAVADEAEEQPMLGAAPAPTPAPVPAERAPVIEEKEAGTPEAAAEAAAPTEVAPSAPPTDAEQGGGASRWILRGFQGAAGAAFLAAVAALLWRRRRRIAGHA